MVKVKIAEKKDLKEFARLRLEANKYASRFDKNVVVSRNTLANLEKLTEKEFEDPRIVYLLALDKDRMIGIAILSLAIGIDKSAFLGELFVEEEYRKRGVGNLLLGRAMSIAKEKKFENFELTVARNNKQAQKFYRNLGFRIRKREYLLLYKSL